MINRYNEQKTSCKIYAESFVHYILTKNIYQTIIYFVSEMFASEINWGW